MCVVCVCVCVCVCVWAIIQVYYLFFNLVYLKPSTGSADNVESDEPMAKKARADALNNMMYPVMAGMAPGMGAMVMPGMHHMGMMPGMGMMSGRQGFTLWFAP